MARTLLLAASTSRWLREHATRAGFVRRSVSRFMPGEHLEDALAAAAAQRTAGIGTILTKLGENLTRFDEAASVTEEYLHTLDRATAAGLGAQISIKPTQLGLDLDTELCAANLYRLVDRAAERGSFVWIDMEGSRYVDSTLDLFRRARSRSSRVGVALQAYLYRTAGDVESLVPSGAAIRLVKGAYLEPPDVAYPKKRDVDANFFRLACRLLDEGTRRPGTLVHLATHDAALVGRLNQFIAERSVAHDAYEYAMLYGIQRPLQHRLVSAGHSVRVLISYGEYWFPWYMRRLAERPANVWFVAKSLFAD